MKVRLICIYINVIYCDIMSKEKKFVKESEISYVLEDFLNPFAYRDFKVNGELYKDGVMAYSFVVYRMKNDKSIRLGIVRFNWRTGYVHCLLPLPIGVFKEFIKQANEMFKVRDEVEKELRFEEIKRKAERFLEELPPEEAEVLREFIEKELRKRKKVKK